MFGIHLALNVQYLIAIWPLQWIRLIVENRPNYSEDVTQLNDVNDIRNPCPSCLRRLQVRWDGTYRAGIH